jgi:hypothetical protein
MRGNSTKENVTRQDRRLSLFTLLTSYILYMIRKYGGAMIGMPLNME